MITEISPLAKFSKFEIPYSYLSTRGNSNATFILRRKRRHHKKRQESTTTQFIPHTSPQTHLQGKNLLKAVATTSIVIGKWDSPVLSIGWKWCREEPKGFSTPLDFPNCVLCGVCVGGGGYFGSVC